MLEGVFVWMLVKEDRRIFDLILAKAFLDVLYEKNALSPDFDMEKAHERFREAERKRHAIDHDAGGN